MPVLSPAGRGASLPAFLVIELAEADDDLPFLFTSQAMRWTEDAWLLDLGLCRRYWCAQASWRRLTPPALIAAVLRQHAGERPFRAVLADTPWPAVFLLAYLKERDLTGLVRLDDPAGRRLYQQATWDAWQAAARQLAAHAGRPDATGARALPRFNPAVFQRRLTHLRQALRRLGEPAPAAMAPVAPAAMRRRFGEHVALLWEWTLAPEQAAPAPGGLLFPEAELPFAAGFPWHAWAPRLKPTVVRHLDHPVWQWDHLEPLLAEDFDRLCRADGWRRGELVTHLSWTLTFDDAKTIPIDVRFRHPHRLHDELNLQKTALLQSLYAFQARYRPDHAASQLIPPQPIIAWSIVVEARMAAQATLTGVFGDAASLDDHARRSLAIENQLPVQVDRYALAGDWLPETSFVAGDAAADETWHPWLAVARYRPLYIYETARPLGPEERDRPVAFLERTAAQWWKGAPPRDYYILADHQDAWRWGFMDGEGGWRVQGVFG